jgi:tetratricopeptide (TPR) repeat protein
VLDARDWAQWAWPVAAVGAGAGAWLARERIGRGLAAGLAFFAVSLAPALGFVSVYPMRYSFVADHFQYLASLGVLALVGAVVARIAATPGAVPIVAVLAALTWRQTHAYADVDTLWRDTLAKNPRSVLAAQNLGTLEYGRGRFDDALALYERARMVEPGNADVLNGIGLVHARRSRTSEAIVSFEAALRSDPRYAEAARNLGSVLGAVGRRDEAIAAYERAVAAAPGMVEAREDLALLLTRAGRADAAERQLREAIRVAPGSLGARVRLGAALAAQGRAADAVAAYVDAVRLAPRSVDVHAALAEARAATGDWTGATTAAERARALALDEGRSATVAEIDRRIARYREGRVAAP